MLGFWLLIILLIAFILLLPPWPYSRRYGWGYTPSGAILVLVLLILLLWWFGMLAIWWPWYATPVQ